MFEVLFPTPNEEELINDVLFAEDNCNRDEFEEEFTVLFPTTDPAALIKTFAPIARWVALTIMKLLTFNPFLTKNAVLATKFPFPKVSFNYLVISNIFQ